MSIVTLILVLAIIGFLLWLILTYLPMEDTVKKILVVAVVVFIVIWLLQGLGLLAPLEAVRIR